MEDDLIIVSNKKMLKNNKPIKQKYEKYDMNYGMNISLTGKLVLGWTIFGNVLILSR